MRTSAFRISTGFVGTPLICDALSNNGYVDVAYRLLLQTGCPSWLYSVTMGATTVWERYDSMLPDGSINPGEMTSFNHYALGAVADWLHRTVAGFAPADVAYRRLRIAPVPGGGLTHARARHLTPYGEAAASWTLDEGVLTVSATVPVGVRAEVVLPGGGEVFEVGHGTHKWTVFLPTESSGRPSTVREVMDDEASWNLLAHAAVGAGLGAMWGITSDQQLASRLGQYLDAPVSVVPDVLTMGGNDPGRARLVEQLAPLLSDRA